MVSPFSSTASSEVLISVYKHSRISQVCVKNTDEPLLSVFTVYQTPCTLTGMAQDWWREDPLGIKIWTQVLHQTLPQGQQLCSWPKGLCNKDPGSDGLWHKGLRLLMFPHAMVNLQIPGIKCLVTLGTVLQTSKGDWFNTWSFFFLLILPYSQSQSRCHFSPFLLPPFLPSPN